MEVDSAASPADVEFAAPTVITEMEEGHSPGFFDVEVDFRQEDNPKGKSSYDSMSVDSPTDHQKPLDISPEIFEKFFKDASRAFFNEWDLASHQIVSFNDFVHNELQELFDSFGEVIVESEYNPHYARTVGAWKHVIISFGKVRLEKPTFWVEKNDIGDELKLTPKHAKLQNMTYSSPMKVMVRVQVYLQYVSDKAKTGTDAGAVHKMVLDDKESEILLGRLPVMVKSDLCCLQSQNKNDCFYDPGGYFLIKCAEKTFAAQEHRCFSRLWITDKPCWTTQYLSEIKRRRVHIKLLESTKAEGSRGGKMISLYFSCATMPIWIMFFALGVSFDMEVFEMIDLDAPGTDVVNMILVTIRDADETCEGFRIGDKAREFVNKLIKDDKFPPTESFDEYIDKFLFPGITGLRQKALFLGCMTKCLLFAYMGNRKCDNKEDFGNKRLELAGKLLSRELWAQMRHVERRMVKSMQRDLNGSDELHLIERYLDSSIITNGLNRVFSTGLWCHPYKRAERTAGIVATLRRTNPLQLIADLRKTRQSVAYAGKTGDANFRRELLLPFATLKKRKRNPEALFQIKQSEYETLCHYIDRFQEEIHDIDEVDPKIYQIAFVCGLQEGMFKFDVICKPPESYGDLIDRANHFVDAENANPNFISSLTQLLRQEQENSLLDRPSVDYLDYTSECHQELYLSMPQHGMYSRHQFRSASRHFRQKRRSQSRTFTSDISPQLPLQDMSSTSTWDHPSMSYTPLRSYKQNDSQKEYTDLILSMEEVIQIIEKEPDFRRPPLLRPNRGGRNKDFFCQYHMNIGHDTEMCRALRDLVEKLIKEGKLQEYIA